MTRPRAPDNNVGSFVQNQSIPWRYTTNAGKVYNSNTSRPVAKWHKSPSATGDRHRSGFREPTSYNRCILRFTPVGTYRGSVYNACGSVRPSWTYDGSDGRAHLDYNTPGINWSTGKVSIDPNLVNRAIVEATLKVQNQKVNLSVALAESKKTLAMIISRIKTLLEMYRAIRKGRWREVWKLLYHRKVVTGSRHLRERVYRISYNGKTYVGTYRQWQTRVSTSWRRNSSAVYLELMYGWLPLMSDIFGGIEQLSEGFREENKIFKVVREVKEPIQVSSFVGAVKPASADGTASAACKVQLWGRVSGVLHRAGAIGLINPLVVAWELVPFSFVIDWLMPVGNWLDHLTATLGVEFVAGCRTDTITASVVLRRTNIYCNNSSPKDDWYSGAPSAALDVFAMNRIKYGGWPWGMLYTRNPLSFTHVSNAIALIRNAKK